MERSTTLPANDTELIRRMAAGEEDALGELYGLYRQRLYAFAMQITADPALAEEAVQESLIAAWKDARRFRGESRVITWLLGIVHHKALNLLRKREDLPIEHAASLPERREAQPEERAARRDQNRALREALDQLNRDHRAVLELVFYQGLSLNEVAEVCRIPVGTVKSRLNSAKTSLRGILSRAGAGMEKLE